MEKQKFRTLKKNDFFSKDQNSPKMLEINAQQQQNNELEEENELSLNIIRPKQTKTYQQNLKKQFPFRTIQHNQILSDPELIGNESTLKKNPKDLSIHSNFIFSNIPSSNLHDSTEHQHSKINQLSSDLKSLELFKQKIEIDGILLKLELERTLEMTRDLLNGNN